MRKDRTFLIPGAHSWIDCQPIKDDPDLQWMGLFIVHTHLHLVQSQLLSLVTHKVWKSPKSETLFFLRMHKSEKMEDTCASKIIPIKLYTHLLYTTKILLSLTNVVKSYYRWKIAKVFLTPSICKSLVSSMLPLYYLIFF